MKGPVEVHPFAPFVPPGSTHLILGTFPTHLRNWRFHSYYPGRANFFWRMLSELYACPFYYRDGDEAVQERLALCTVKRIALSDTIQRCRRTQENSSKDSDLEVLELRDTIHLLEQHPTIQHIILTGSSGQVSAHRLFFQHLASVPLAAEVETGRPPLNGQFTCFGITRYTHTLYSTSGINIGRYAQAKEQYRKYLPK